MSSLTLAYRDDDRLPMIFAIREIARRHYDLNVRQNYCPWTSTCAGATIPYGVEFRQATGENVNAVGISLPR